MVTYAITCRTCGGHDTEDLGALPDVASFAGVRLKAALHGGHLHLCRHCGFVYRDPILKDDIYFGLYSAGNTDVWESQGKRKDFEMVRQLIPDAPIDVLDVGCYTGQLLAGLPAACRLHGVEPNAAAAAKAEARGVRIAADHWEHADNVLCYDLITACDVIEHVGNPLEFLACLASRLKPGGRVILTTGNSEAWLWKQMRSRFWYCHYPEHISFIGPRWLSLMSTRAGLRVTRIERFCHAGNPGLLSTLSALAQMAIFLLSPLAYRNLHRLATGMHGDVVPPPGGRLTKDHILCELVKI